MTRHACPVVCVRTDVQVYNSLCEQTVELVLTAHPTQVCMAHTNGQTRPWPLWVPAVVLQTHYTQQHLSRSH
jgi:hypothetical protein